MFLPVPLFNHTSQLCSWMPSHRISKPALLTVASALTPPALLTKLPLALLSLLRLQFAEVLTAQAISENEYVAEERLRRSFR